MTPVVVQGQHVLAVPSIKCTTQRIQCVFFYEVCDRGLTRLCSKENGAPEDIAFILPEQRITWLTNRIQGMK